MLYDVSKEKVVEKGKIVKIEVGDYTQAFKNPEAALSRARDPERAKQREYAIITVQVDNTEFSESHGIPKGAKYDEKANKWVVVDKFALARSMKNLNNWLTKYNMKYGKDPQVGDEVEITLNEKGFQRISVVG